MTEDTMCQNCDESQATTIEDFGDGVIRICDECNESMPYDEYLNKRVSDIVAEVQGYNVSQYTLDNHCEECAFSDEIGISSMMIRLSDGQRVLPECEEDVGNCRECGHTAHVDDFTDYNDRAYCMECVPHVGDRWDDSFRKIDCLNFKKYPVRNYVGMEFESEGKDCKINHMMYPDLTDLYIAQAKEDGSLTDGTEYVSHPLRGDDIKECIDQMCEALASDYFTLGDNVGWHFHYDMSNITTKRQKNVWKAMREFSDLMDTNSFDYKYFQMMLRHYSENWSRSYKEWAGEWANSERAVSYSRYSPSDNNRGSNQGRYVWSNFEPLRRDRDTIEIRMYSPHKYRRMCTDKHSWDSDMYQLLAEDYSKFIRFWHEFIRKSAYNPNGLKCFKNNGEYLSITEFAGQFSSVTETWLVNRYEEIKARYD